MRALFRLQQIYADLRKACTKPKPSKPAEPAGIPVHVEKETLSGFENLKIERGQKKKPPTEVGRSIDVEKSHDDGQSPDDQQFLDDQDRAELVDSKRKLPPRLVDDGLAEAFELCKEVQVDPSLFISDPHPVFC